MDNPILPHNLRAMQLTKHWAGQLDDYAIDLAWSPDGSRLAAASAAGPLVLFGASEGQRLHELPGHENGTNVLTWLAGRSGDEAQETGDRGQGTGDRGQEAGDRRQGTGDGEQGTGGSVPEITKGSSVSSVARHLSPVTCLLATGGQDGAVKFWDCAAGQHTATVKLGMAWVEHLASAQGLLFAAAGRVLSAIRSDGSIAHTFKPAPKTISALAAQSAGGSIAAAYFGGVVLWDTDDFVAQKEFTYGNGIQALVWSPDNKWLVSGNQDPSVHLWIPENDVELHMSGYETKVKFLSFDHSSRWLATSGGRDACIWDCTGAGPEGREPAMLPHDAPVCAVKFQNAHGLLATAAQDGVVQLWSPERKQPLRATVKMPSAATKLAWSPDDRQLAIGTEKGVIYVLKCET